MRDACPVLGCQHVVQTQQRVVGYRRLNCPDIDPGTAQVARRQCIEQRGFIMNAAARRGDEKRACLHAGKLGRTHQPTGAGIQRAMQLDHVGALQQRRQ